MLERVNERARKLERTNTVQANRQPTFRDLLEQTRKQAAGLAWERAKLASSLRHYAAITGQPRAARTLASVKRHAVARAITLLPNVIRVSVDEDFHVGLLTIGWRGHGRLRGTLCCAVSAAPSANAFLPYHNVSSIASNSME